MKVFTDELGAIQSQVFCNFLFVLNYYNKFQIRSSSLVAVTETPIHYHRKCLLFMLIGAVTITPEKIFFWVGNWRWWDAVIEISQYLG